MGGTNFQVYGRIVQQCAPHNESINLTAAASPDCITAGREAVACLVWGKARRMDMVPTLQAFSEKKRRAWPYPALAPLEKPSSLLSDRASIE